MSNHNKSALNQRQWLNIIIIAISAAFLLFVLLGKMLNQSVEKQQVQESKVEKKEIQKKQSELMQIDFGDFQLIKEKNQWKSIKKQLSLSDIDRTIRSWQMLLNKNGESIDLNVTAAVPIAEKIILLYVSNSTQPIVCKLIQLKNKYEIIFVTLKTKFSLASEEVNLYYPEIIRS